MKIILINCLLLAGISFAEPVNISGVLMDGENNPIPGASLQLKSSGLNTLSDSSGAFLISGDVLATEGSQPTSLIARPQLHGNRLYFSVKNSRSSISLDIYNLKGQKVKNLYRDPLRLGNYEMNPRSGLGRQHPSGVYVVSITVGKKRYAFKFLHLDKSIARPQSISFKKIQRLPKFLKQQAVSDTLIITANKFYEKKIAIDSLTMDLDTIKLDAIPGEYVEQSAGVVFDQSIIRTYNITMLDSTWQWLKINAKQEEYVSGMLTITEQTSTDSLVMGEVGIRFKGGFGTLESCVDSEGNLLCDKLSMKIKFSEYDKTKRLFGLKKINLHSMESDPGHLNDQLAYWLFAQMNIMAPRTAFAKLTINGEYRGLFALIEQIDGRFTDSRFPKNGDGNLYKEVWPIKEEEAGYKEKQKTNQDSSAQDMVDFAAEINAAGISGIKSVIASRLDTAYMARYLAVDQSILNWDGISAWYCGLDVTNFDTVLGCQPHNMYWYHEENKNTFWLIPWDMDHTFELSFFSIIKTPWFETYPVDCDKEYKIFGCFLPHFQTLPFAVINWFSIY